MVLALVLIGLVADPVQAAKSDVVVLRNGDRITCEIKSLTRGRLRVSTDDMGTVDIEWRRVQQLTASGLFEVEDLAGRLYYGALEPGPDGGQLKVVGTTDVDVLDIVLVARIQPIKPGFWKRLDGSIDVGFGYTSSSRLAELSLDARLTFRRPSFKAQLEASSLIKRQPDVADTQRNSATFGYTRFRGNRHFVLGQVSAEQNRELGYNLRAGVLGAYGQYLVRSLGHELAGVVGVHPNREVPVEGESHSNLEALVGLQWDSFAYGFPKTDIGVGLVAFVSVSDWGRWRLELDARLDRELFKDFRVVLKAYESYDSRPATRGANRNDWGVTLALGYSF